MGVAEVVDAHVEVDAGGDDGGAPDAGAEGAPPEERENVGVRMVSANVAPNVGERRRSLAETQYGSDLGRYARLWLTCPSGVRHVVRQPVRQYGTHNPEVAGSNPAPATTQHCNRGVEAQPSRLTWGAFAVPGSLPGFAD